MSAPEKTEADEGARGSGSLVSINVSDALGLGVAAKSPAALEIAKALGKLVGMVTDPTRLLLMGLASNKVEAHQINSIARAELDALRLVLEAEPLVERMKRRVVGTEVRHQLNIEATAAEAMDDLNRKHGSAEGRPIDDQWFANWLEGAKEASSSEVRSMWAKLLEAQALSAQDTVSGPSLHLLRSMDSNLARAFSDFICYLVAYGCYPLDEGMRANAVPLRTLALLEEIGFVSTGGIGKELAFHDFKLRRTPRIRGLAISFSYARLTHRAHELATAIYADEGVLAGRLPDPATKAATLISFIEAAKGTQSLLLVFPRKGGAGGEAAVRLDWSTPRHLKPFLMPFAS